MQLRCGLVIAGCRRKRQTDGAYRIYLVASLDCVNGSDDWSSPITNHSTSDSITYASLNASRTIQHHLQRIRMSTKRPLLFALDWKLHVFTPPMVR
ncbi:hypothetical protein TNCV_354821 [Trichonephila clavipes]|uniref:Uncharacterized protein n=1 Tax=Trichonephila clavipes TaxID=2585209 RepID=A0A8X6W1F5_TRICX|nr:hypothetical protein TNCV_354821 [Trichonephila clavipes]